MPPEESLESDRSPVLSRTAVAIVVLTLVAVAVATLWLVVSVNQTRPAPGHVGTIGLLTIDRPFPPDGRFPRDPYVGPKSCAECHPGEAAAHARSGHAMTLRAAGKRSLSRRLDGTTVADPERPDVSWSYQYRDGNLQIARSTGRQVEKWIADYALGSGHHATTFVTVLDRSIPKILEHRLTYFTAEHALGLTPGQRAGAKTQGVTPEGREPNPRDARK